MKRRTVSTGMAGEQRTIVVVLDAGDEVMSSLSDVAEQEGLSAASFTAVGALASATLGWYDLAAQRYEEIAVSEQAELLSLVGDVSLGPDGRQVHAHAVVGLRSGCTRGGHLLAGTVRPTVEIVLTASPAVLRRTFRPEVGIALIDLDAGGAPSAT